MTTVAALGPVLAIQAYVTFCPDKFQRGPLLTVPLRRLLVREALRRESTALAVLAVHVRMAQLLAIFAVAWFLPPPVGLVLIGALYVDDLLADVRPPRRDRLPLKNRVRWKWLPDPLPYPAG